MKGRRSKLHIFKFYSVCFSLNITRILKSRRLKWMGSVTCVGCNERVQKFDRKTCREDDLLKDTYGAKILG